MSDSETTARDQRRDPYVANEEDIVLLGVSLWTLGDSLGAQRRARSVSSRTERGQQRKFSCIQDWDGGRDVVSDTEGIADGASANKTLRGRQNPPLCRTLQHPVATWVVPPGEIAQPPPRILARQLIAKVLSADGRSTCTDGASGYGSATLAIDA